MTRLRYGILGAGNISRQFATGVAESDRCAITATASRDRTKAEAFNREHAPSAAAVAYDALLARDDVDAIYLALPNNLHSQWAHKALSAGKHVLCEKPLATNAAEAEQMFAAAAAADRVLVEAFMYRAHPQTAALMSRVAQGVVGKLKLVRSSFCFRIGKPQGNIRFSRALAGGALMDVGCYCVNFARMLAGCDVADVRANGLLTDDGVDELTSATLTFTNGMVSQFVCGTLVQNDNAAYVCGTDGFLKIDWPWKPSAGKSGFTLGGNVPPRQDNPQGPPAAPRETTFDVPGDRDLYAIEADAFAACVLDGDEPFMPVDQTLANMRTLDEIRRQLGVRFQADA